MGFHEGWAVASISSRRWRQRCRNSNDHRKNELPLGAAHPVDRHRAGIPLRRGGCRMADGADAGAFAFETGVERVPTAHAMRLEAGTVFPIGRLIRTKRCPQSRAWQFAGRFALAPVAERQVALLERLTNQRNYLQCPRILCNNRTSVVVSNTNGKSPTHHRLAFGR
jgi:hypothetical protein